MDQEPEIRRAEETVVLSIRVQKTTVEALEAYAKLEGLVYEKSGKPSVAMAVRDLLEAFADAMDKSSAP